jgi:hypothetical protein
MVLRALAALSLVLLIPSAPAAAQSCSGQFPAGTVCGNNTSVQGPPRPVTAVEVLAFDRTYYFRTDGNNANTCLANTAAGACRTAQAALTKCFTVNLSGHNCTAQAGNNFTATKIDPVAILGAQTGIGTITLRGDPTTPSNMVAENTIGAQANIFAGGGANLHVTGFKLQATTAFTYGSGLYANGNGTMITMDHMDFGAMPGIHREAIDGGAIIANGDYTISGSAYAHEHAHNQSFIENANLTLTITGTPNFSGNYSRNGYGFIFYTGITFAGTGATGSRFYVHENGAINTNSNNLNYFPGNSPGFASSGGVYVMADAGEVSLYGTTSGIINITPQAVAGSYSFNLPTTAGTSGQPLLSGGGLAGPMTWGSTTGVGAFVLAAGGTISGTTINTSVISFPSLDIADTAFNLRDDGDVTKILNFQLSGITTGTTRTMTAPNYSGTALLTSSPGTTTTVLHGNAAGAPTFGAVSLTADVTSTLPVANGGTNYTGGAWTTTTVTATPATGSWTSTTTWRYLLIGKWLVGNANVVVSSVAGGPGGIVTVPMPTGASASFYSTYGNQSNNGTTSGQSSCTVNTGGTSLSCALASFAVTTYGIPINMEIQ